MYFEQVANAAGQFLPSGLLPALGTGHWSLVSGLCPLSNTLSPTCCKGKATPNVWLACRAGLWSLGTGHWLLVSHHTLCVWLACRAADIKRKQGLFSPHYTHTHQQSNIYLQHFSYTEPQIFIYLYILYLE